MLREITWELVRFYRYLSSWISLLDTGLLWTTIYKTSADISVSNDVGQINGRRKNSSTRIARSVVK